jgi:hypothetical protein
MAEPMQREGPERTARVMLTAAVAAMSYLDYFQYKRTGLGEPGAWDALAAGQGSAPDQYRVSVVLAARWLATHLHGRLPLAMTLIDLGCALIAVHLLWNVFTRTRLYRKAGTELRWLGAAVFVLLPPWYFAWLFWLSKPETLPTAMLLATMLWLWQPARELSAARGVTLRVVALLALTLLLSIMRADQACFFNLGMAFVAWRRRSQGGGLALPRTAAVATGLAGALLAGAIQAWLSRYVFPQAHYGAIKFWQLWPNLHHASRWPPFVSFGLPAGWTAVQVVRRRFGGDMAGLGVLCGAAAFLALWAVIGKFDEVRVFLPFALALAPLTAQMVMLRVSPAPEQG